MQRPHLWKLILYIIIGLFGIAGFLVITNPSMRDFKEFLGSDSSQGNQPKRTERRMNNYLIFSVFQEKKAGGASFVYIGIARNFFKKENDSINHLINKEKKKVPLCDSISHSY